jgi:hypothetical protein
MLYPWVSVHDYGGIVDPFRLPVLQHLERDVIRELPYLTLPRSD